MSVTAGMVLKAGTVSLTRMIVSHPRVKTEVNASTKLELSSVYVRMVLTGACVNATSMNVPPTPVSMAPSAMTMWTPTHAAVHQGSQGQTVRPTMTTAPQAHV